MEGSYPFTGLYTGKDLDPDTGLYYFNARWYDPDIGKFISEDPAGQGTNWYSYCGNSPLMNTDPSGMSFWGDVGNFFSSVGQGIANAWGKITGGSNSLGNIVGTVLTIIVVAVLVVAAVIICTALGSPEVAPYAVGAIIGTFIGGALVNHSSMNAFAWKWNDGHTWWGMALGAGYGAAAGGALSWIVANLSGVDFLTAVGALLVGARGAGAQIKSIGSATSPDGGNGSTVSSGPQGSGEYGEDYSTPGNWDLSQSDNSGMTTWGTYEGPMQGLSGRIDDFSEAVWRIQTIMANSPTYHYSSQGTSLFESTYDCSSVICTVFGIPRESIQEMRADREHFTKVVGPYRPGDVRTYYETVDGHWHGEIYMGNNKWAEAVDSPARGVGPKGGVRVIEWGSLHEDRYINGARHIEYLRYQGVR